MQNKGWIKLHRQIFDSKHDFRHNHAQFFAWSWILGNATHQHYTQVVGCKEVELAPGQLVTGRDKLAEHWGITSQKVRTILKSFKNRKMITIKSTTKYSIITVVNWDQYQGKDTESNQQTNQRPNQQVTSNQPTNPHKQEYKNKRTKEKTSPLPPPPEGSSQDNAHVDTHLEVVEHDSYWKLLKERLPAFSSLSYADYSAIRQQNISTPESNVIPSIIERRHNTESPSEDPKAELSFYWKALGNQYDYQDRQSREEPAHLPAV